jgi:hypothetical protein
MHSSLSVGIRKNVSDERAFAAFRCFYSSLGSPEMHREPKTLILFMFEHFSIEQTDIRHIQMTTVSTLDNL